MIISCNIITARRQIVRVLKCYVSVILTNKQTLNFKHPFIFQSTILFIYNIDYTIT